MDNLLEVVIQSVRIACTPCYKVYETFQLYDLTFQSKVSIFEFAINAIATAFRKS